MFEGRRSALVTKFGLAAAFLGLALAVPGASAPAGTI